MWTVREIFTKNGFLTKLFVQWCRRRNSLLTKKYLSPARVMRSARNQSYSVINNKKPPIGSISKLFGRNISLFGDIHEKLDFSNFESYLFQNTKFFSLFRYVFDNHLTGYFTTLNIQHQHKNLIKKNIITSGNDQFYPRFSLLHLTVVCQCIDVLFFRAPSFGHCVFFPGLFRAVLDFSRLRVNPALFCIDFTNFGYTFLFVVFFPLCILSVFNFLFLFFCFSPTSRLFIFHHNKEEQWCNPVSGKLRDSF